MFSPPTTTQVLHNLVDQAARRVTPQRSRFTYSELDASLRKVRSQTSVYHTRHSAEFAKLTSMHFREFSMTDDMPTLQPLSSPADIMSFAPLAKRHPHLVTKISYRHEVLRITVTRSTSCRSCTKKQISPFSSLIVKMSFSTLPSFLVNTRFT